ncbi:NAD(P)H-dependent oxidoreductase [Paenibacillus sp. GCM10012303]|uniref:NAD(P)H-dependent oxidoreductase n=1 Tax=Paenibacillus sp. GCM10012303 TaxID=3317340 RepID=UPI00362317F1
MKTLVIVTHPNIESSVIHKRWAKELMLHPAKYTVHELHQAYPDGNLDVEREQMLVESHGNLVLQFPIYWFSCPPLVKKWLDEVLTYGWAYGSNGDKMRNRKVALGVSTGVKKEDYSEVGKYLPLTQILVPFQLTFEKYCKADYRSFFAFYGTESEPGELLPGIQNETSENAVDKSAIEYLSFLDKL